MPAAVPHRARTRPLRASRAQPLSAVCCRLSKTTRTGSQVPPFRHVGVNRAEGPPGSTSWSSHHPPRRRFAALTLRPARRAEVQARVVQLLSLRSIVGLRRIRWKNRAPRGNPSATFLPSQNLLHLCRFTRNPPEGPRRAPPLAPFGPIGPIPRAPRGNHSATILPSQTLLFSAASRAPNFYITAFHLYPYALRC